MAKTPQACGCGCGGMTKGGRFLPGHDARFHAAQKAGHNTAAVKRATGAHGTASAALPDSWAASAPSGNEKAQTGDGTTVRVGMRVRATVSGKPREGTVYHVSRYGQVAFVDDGGHQLIGYPGMTWVVNDDPKAVTRALTTEAKTVIARLVS